MLIIKFSVKKYWIYNVINTGLMFLKNPKVQIITKSNSSCKYKSI